MEGDGIYFLTINLKLLADEVKIRLKRKMAAVPYGLPVMPPHWVFTVNVWTYEIIGRYEVFTITDNNNEAIPKPYFGHKGQKYVRKYERINHPYKRNLDGSSIWIGTNNRASFHFSEYSTTIVGPGPKGVGDKTGGNSEESIGYGDLLSEIGIKL